MQRSRKEEIVEKFREDLPEAQSIVLTNHTGIDVNTINELRAEFRANDVHYHVVKNTLARIAIEGTDVEPLAEKFKYPTAVAYSFEDAVMPAKIALDFAEDHEEYEVKCGFLKGQVLDRDSVEGLADMPSREDSLARIVNTLREPAKKVVRTLDAPAKKFVRILRAMEQEGSQ